MFVVTYTAMALPSVRRPVKGRQKRQKLQLQNTDRQPDDIVSCLILFIREGWLNWSTQLKLAVVKFGWRVTAVLGNNHETHVCS